PHEANFLKLDCSKFKTVFGWTPCWNLGDAVKYTVEWAKCLRDGGDIKLCMDSQMDAFVSVSKWMAKKNNNCRISDSIPGAVSVCKEQNKLG
ncbi:MAG: hypothetical protein J6Q77_02520, partial [Clostridia bacterium]|nr:hypothetical protein [Clostridia bacterium]